MISYNKKEIIIEDDDDIMTKNGVVNEGRDKEAKREDVKGSGEDKNINFVTQEKCLSIIEIID